MKKTISRRYFLIVALVSLGTTIIQACAPEPLKPSTIIPSLMPTPLQLTETTEPTSEPLPLIEAQGWAENEKGSIDAEQLYPYVGDWILSTPQGVQLASSKNRAVDLKWEWMRIVYVGDQDVQHEGFDQKAYRQFIAEQLNRQIDFIKSLAEIKMVAGSQDLSTTTIVIVINGPDFSNKTPTYISGIDEHNSRITAIASDTGIAPKWYRINEFNRRELVVLTHEQEPILLPPLRIEGGRYIRTDSGEEVMMRGLDVGFHGRLDLSQKSFRLDRTFQQFKETGGNFVAVHVGKDLFNNSNYYLGLSELLEKARNKFGFRTLLSIGWYENGEMIRVIDSQLVEDWKTLLNYEDPSNPFWDNSNFASFVTDKVDIYDIIWEPMGDFSFFNPHLDTACGDIRTLVGPNAICAYSNGSWFADNAMELVGREAEFLQSHPNTIISIHPYKLDNYELTGRHDPREYIKILRDKGVVVTPTEMGWRDWEENPDWLNELFKYFEENKISYVVDNYEYMIGLWSK